MSVSNVTGIGSYSNYLAGGLAVAAGVGVAVTAPAWIVPVAIGGAAILLAGALSGCGDISNLPTTPEGNKDFSDAAEEGIPGTQPDVTEIAGNLPADQVEVDETGGACVDTDGSGECGEVADNYILPVDSDGNYVLPGEAFFSTAGTSALSGTPTLNVGWRFQGYYGDVNWTDYRIGLFTDSTLLTGMTEEAVLFPGLVSANQATEEEQANGWACPETGYEPFLLCPGYPENQLPVYLAGYTLTFYNEYGERLETRTVENIPTDEAGVETFFTDPTPFNAFLVPTRDNPFDLGAIPEEGSEAVNNSRTIGLHFHLIVDNRQAADGVDYLTTIHPVVEEILESE